MKITFITFLVATLPVCLVAQDWTHYTEANGLISNDVVSLHIDQDDNVWVGTEDGLVRFDGEDWETYQCFPKMNSSTIESIEEDKFGRLWLGIGNFSSKLNTSFGLITMSEVTWNIYTRSQSLKNVIPENFYIKDIAIDHQNAAWMVSSNGQVLKYDGFQWLSLWLPNDPVFGFGITVDSHNDVWVGSSEGLTKISNMVLTTYTKADGLAGDEVLDIAEDRDGNIWISTLRGLSMYDGIRFTNYHMEDGLLSNQLTQLEFDSKGNLWIGSFKGVTKYNGKSFINYSFGNFNLIEEIKVDSDDNVWVIERGNGLFRLDADAPEPIPTEINSPDLFANIYPNPATKSIEIDCKGFEKAAFYDLQGKLKWESTEQSVDVSSWKSGQYIVRIAAGDQVYYSKLIVE